MYIVTSIVTGAVLTGTGTLGCILAGTAVVVVVVVDDSHSNLQLELRAMLDRMNKTCSTAREGIATCKKKINENILVGIVMKSITRSLSTGGGGGGTGGFSDVVPFDEFCLLYSSTAAGVARILVMRSALVAFAGRVTEAF